MQYLVNKTINVDILNDGKCVDRKTSIVLKAIDGKFYAIGYIDNGKEISFTDSIESEIMKKLAMDNGFNVF